MSETTRARRRRTRVAVGVGVALAALVVAFAALTARLIIWPSLPPVPTHADAILELGGEGQGDRDRVTRELAEQGVAPVVVKSTAEEEAAATNDCMAPVAGVEIICFYPQPFTTRGEARTLADLAAQRGWRSVIIVTTADQAWRANVRVGRCFDGHVATATAHLPWRQWPYAIVYQWGATVKAFTYERSC